MGRHVLHSAGLAGLCALAGVLVTFGANAGTNSWILSGSGNWGIASDWSSGQLPGAGDSVVITNTGTKTVTINATTPTNSLTVTNLTIAAPGAAVNTLTINTSTNNPPVHVLTDFFLERGGAVNVQTHGFLQVDGLTSVGALGLGASGTGSFNLNAGIAQLHDLILGDGTNSSGALNLSNGTLRVTGTLTLANWPFTSTGAATVFGGTLIHTNGVIVLGSYGNGTFFARGGSVDTLGFQIGNGTGSQGALTVSNSTVFASDYIWIGNNFGANPCSVTVYGSGSVFVTNNTHSGYVAIAANSSLNLYGGLLETDSLINTNGGTCNTANGTLTITQPAQVENGSTYSVSSGTASFGSDFTLGAGAGSTGAVVVASGGTLNVTNSLSKLGIGNDGTLTGGAGVGTVTVSGSALSPASINAATLNLGSSAGGQGSLAIQAHGVVNVSSDMTLVSSSLSVTSSVVVTGGTLNVPNGTLAIGPTGNGVMIVNDPGSTVIAKAVKLGGAVGTGALHLLAGLLKAAGLSTNFILVGGGDLDGSGGTVIIGEAHNAELAVTSGNATNMGTLYVGYTPGFTGTYNQSGGITQVTNNMTVGTSDCVSGAVGAATLGGSGALYVTNAAHTAVLTLNNGSFTMNGGTLVADTLDVSSACGHFSNNGGVIHYNQLVVSPNAAPLALGSTVDAQSSTLTISWPSIYVGYGLEQCSDLSLLSWTSVSQTPSDDGTTRSVTINPIPTSGSMFYRLAKPNWP